MNDANVLVIEEEGGAAVSSAEVLTDVEIRKLTREIEALREVKRNAEQERVEVLAEIETLRKTYHGKPPSEYRTGSRGEMIELGPAVRLRNLLAGVAAAEKAMRVVANDIADREARLRASETAAAASIASGADFRAYNKHVEKHIAAVTKLQAAADRFGAALQDAVFTLAELRKALGTQRAENALSLDHLKILLAYAAGDSFAVTWEDRFGNRHRQEIIKMQPTDPTSPWRGKTVLEIERAHVDQIVREAVRERARLR